MKKLRLAFTGALAFVASASAQVRGDENVPDLLLRQTRELVDAISSGSAAVWDRYLEPEARYIDESGAVLTKKEMVGGIRPLPEGVSGSIQVTRFEAVVKGDVAVTTYVDDETEDYHGHVLHCQYRTTDTWRKTPEGWRLLAGQVTALRADPPAVTLPASMQAEYCGRYSLTPAITYEIRCAGGALEGQRNGRKPERLLAEAPDVLFVPGSTRYRYVFRRGADGKITGFAQRREAWDLIWTRTGPPKS